MSPESGRSSGFTLLEVMVALVIAGLALGVLFSGAVTGMRSAKLSLDYMEAVSRAQSHLDALGIGAPLIPGTQHGDDGDGFIWRTHVRPLGTTATASQSGLGAAAPRRLALYAVTVVIGWTKDGGHRQVELNSERIGPAPTDKP